MAHLNLRLTGERSIALRASAFYHAAFGQEVHYRADREPERLSPGLKAFLILALNTAASGRRAGAIASGRSASLRGGPDSPAATLSRLVCGGASTALTEIFGRTPSGFTAAPQLLCVENFEDRTMRFVTVGFNRSLLLPNEIHFHWNGVALDDPETLERLAAALESDWAPFHRSQLAQPDAGFGQFLEQIFSRELSETLSLPDLSTSAVFAERIQSLLKHSALSRLGGFDLLEGLRPLSLRPGLGNNCTGSPGLTNSLPPVRLAIPPSLGSSLALFRYLELEEHQPLTLDYDFGYSHQVVQCITSGSAHRRPDLCVLALPTVLREVQLSLPENGGYQPIYLLPQTTHRLLAPKTAFAKPQSRRAARRYHFMTEAPGTGYVYFRELVDQGCITADSSSLEHTEPNRLLAALAEGDAESRAIIWFPHYDLNCLLNNCLLIDAAKDSLAHQGIVLLASEDFRRNDGAMLLLSEALERAWRRLRDDPGTRERIVRSLTSDTAYRRVLLAGCGVSESTAHSKLQRAAPRPQPQPGSIRRELAAAAF